MVLSKSLLRPSIIYKLCLMTIAVCYVGILYRRIAFPSKREDATKEALEEVAKDMIRHGQAIGEDMKYILLWTQADYSPFHLTTLGQEVFISNNCSNTNCYLTRDRNFLGDIKKFDAIAFNGRNLKRDMELPEARSPRQKYIYFNMESTENYPVCFKQFDGYFNWTATYRLDTDIPWTYFRIIDDHGTIVGPSKLAWERNQDTNTTRIKEKLIDKIQHRNKAAAWFVSNCHSKSNREQFVKNLQKALKPYNLGVDVYGSCGTLSCPKNQHDRCTEMLGKEYYFYLALENSFATDYVTEKLLTALENHVVPIVLGGADYSRFLPPGSYINGLEYNSTELAHLIDQLMKNRDDYLNYFEWIHKYKFVEEPNICSLCTALNNRTMVETKSVYEHLRRWWNFGYRDLCLTWYSELLIT